MHSSSDSMDEPSRLKQFAWEQWDDQVFVVIFRPGQNGLERYVLKRYVEQVLNHSNQWKYLSCYFTKVVPSVRSYTLTSYEIQLLQKILNFHLSNKFTLQITQANDQLIQYEDLLDFITSVQKFRSNNPYKCDYVHSISGKIATIPSIHSCYTLPTTSMPLTSPVVQSTEPQVKSAQPVLSELSSAALRNTKVDDNGWIQINNVYVPFIVKNDQRLVPYQVLVACKILEPNELKKGTIYATAEDVILFNAMIRECKTINEAIPANAILINVYNVLIGSKNLVYAKILPKDNPTSKINRQYKDVLNLNGGLLHITSHLVPFVCSTNHSYIPLNSILNICPDLSGLLRKLSRAPHENELDYLQLVQIYFNADTVLSSDTQLVATKDLHQTTLVLSKVTTLNAHRQNEKEKFERRLALVSNLIAKKRKYQESLEKSRLKKKTAMAPPLHQSTPTSIRPMAGCVPTRPSISSQNQSPQLNNQNPKGAN